MTVSESAMIDIAVHAEILKLIANVANLQQNYDELRATEIRRREYYLERARPMPPDEGEADSAFRDLTVAKIALAEYVCKQYDEGKL